MEKEKPEVYKKKYSFNHFHSKNDGGEGQAARIISLVKQYVENQPTGKYSDVLGRALTDLIREQASADGDDLFTITPYITSEVATLEDSDVPRYMYHRYRYDMFPLKRELDDYPPYLQIEPSSICNYRCVFCYQTDETFSNRKSGHMGMMSVELFKKIIDKIEGHVDFISLSSRGEPLACKDIDKMLEYTQGKFLGLKMNTNASLLTEKKAHAILSSGISTLVYSADAAEEPMYSTLRVRGNLDKVVKNVEMFQNIKQKHYSDSKMITRVSGVKVNEDQDIEEMLGFWDSMVDQVAFVKYNPWENVYSSSPNDVTNPCSDLWRRMFIWYDGKANPCDTDYKTSLLVGNIQEKSLSELWHSEQYTMLREKHANNKRSELEPCRRCVVT